MSTNNSNENPTPVPERVFPSPGPPFPTLSRWMFDGVAEATDGCIVEPDGVCEHGCNSWLLELGYI